MANELGSRGNSQTKNCYRCGGTFKNSRALCGHMRIHSSKPRPTNNKKTLKATHTTKFKKYQLHKGIGNQISEGQNINVNCPHCDKSFPSMRSLHGHLRMHPGKVWRGIQPPSAAGDRVDSDAALSSDQKPAGTSTATNEEETSPTQLKKRNETEESQLANSEQKKDMGIGIGSYSEIFKRGFLSGKTLGGHK